MTTPTPSQYPIPRPPSGEDNRFTLGLLIDITDVLIAHGYPAPSGLDLVDLQQGLFRTIYTRDDA